MRVAILGYGLQGQSAYRYWQSQGHELTICDAIPAVKVPADAQTQLGKDYLRNLDRFDLLVRTPVLHPRDITAANPDSPNILNKVTTVTNEFFRVCPSQNIIGVTGTKGKGTTSTLITKILEAGGKTVHLGGNIGIPPLDMLQNDIQSDDWVVLELANFQLIDLKHSPKVAACLMVAPEHMDWHPDMAEYVTAKQQLFRFQTPQDLAVYHRLNEYSRQISGISPAQKVAYEVPKAGLPPQVKTGVYVDGETIYAEDTAIGRTADVALLGRHNLENICAAIAATWEIIERDKSAVTQVITSFSGLEHRLELVRELDGVRYYDDSFGTAPETAIVAVQAFPEPKVLILGGSDKGADYSELAHVVATNNVRRVVLIGRTGPAIEAALRTAGFNDIVDGGKDMASIVNTARSQAKPGDVILLSTACASFDMFKNYKDRGMQFKQAVQALA